MLHARPKFSTAHRFDTERRKIICRKSVLMMTGCKSDMRTDAGGFTASCNSENMKYKHKAPRGRRPHGSNGLPMVWCTDSGTWKDSTHGGVVLPMYTDAQVKAAQLALNKAGALGVQLIMSKSSNTGYKCVWYDSGRLARPRRFKCSAHTGYFLTAEEAALEYAKRICDLAP